jgi:hypothetical protein
MQRGTVSTLFRYQCGLITSSVSRILKTKLPDSSRTIAANA